MMAAFVLVLHVLSTASFFGSIVSTFVGKRYAERKASARQLSSAIRIIVAIDRFVTAPSAAILTLSGFVLVWLKGYPLLGLPWLQKSLLLWFLSALLAISQLAPLTHKLLAECENNQDGPPSPQYKGISKRWNRMAGTLLLSPVPIFYWMLIKG
jgi:uncharacterized membrane protein